MRSEVQIIEERLKSLLGQLLVEYGILDRIVYKNKNQHRRCSYFQYLIKVRRDLRILQATSLEELLNSSFQVISGMRPKQKVQALESLKRRCCDGGKYNFLERLLGAARVLSQMVEPMLKAAEQVATLLAQSFFMGFSMTVLALLARIRVLVQQMLLDVVDVYNRVFSLSRKQQSVKLNQEGIEVFREYYPTKEPGISLECLWKGDKFVLHENVICEACSHDKDTGEKELGASTVQYQSIEAMLSDDGCSKVIDPGKGDSTENDGERQGDTFFKAEDVSSAAPEKDQLAEMGSITDAMPISSPIKPKPEKKNKVAFISVKKPETSPTSAVVLRSTGIKSQSDDNGDPFFSLLTGGNTRESLF